MVAAMSPRISVLLCGVLACSGSSGDTPASASTPTGASASDPDTATATDVSGAPTTEGADGDATQAATTAGPGGDPGPGPGPTGDPGGETSTTSTTGDGDATSDASKSTTEVDTTTGPVTGCGDVDYTGYCDGTVLVWCEDESLKMVDCAADGRVCVFESEQIGYNCVVPPDPGGGFGYPVGDKTSSPAGGWTVTQVLANYYPELGGGHLAHDIAVGEAQTANAPVYAVGDGVVRYAGPNASSYVHVVLIEHTYGAGDKICSFYGHLNAPNVGTGQMVSRGEQIATVLDQSGNSHLHYVMLGMQLCDASAAANGALICGYDGTSAFNGVTDLSNEPAVYTALPNVCGNEDYPDAFLSPSKFIDAHHF